MSSEQGSILQLNEFFIEGGNQELSHVLLHITEPSTPEERFKGYFFAVCEINNGTTEQITQLQSIIDDIENKYYEVEDQTDKNALEIALELVNQSGRNLLKSTPALNCTVGVLRQPQIIFSHYGHPLLLLLYKNRQNTYQPLNLIDQEDENKVDDPAQLFSQIVEGKLSDGDYLVAATPEVATYFTGDRLQKIITSRPAEDSAAHIQKVLADLKSDRSFGGLIIYSAKQNIIEERTKVAPFIKNGSRKSLKNLFNTEEKTALTLAPSILGKLRSRFPETNDSYLEKETTTIQRPSPPPANIKSNHTHQLRQAAPQKSKFLTPDQLTTIVKVASKIFISLWRAIWWCLVTFIGIIQRLGQFAVDLFIIATNIHQGRRRIVENWKRTVRNFRETLVRLPTTTRIILAVALIGATGLIFSIVYLRAAERERQAAATYAVLVQEIKTKRDSAESSLVYHNETAALKDLNAAETILKNLPCRSKTEKETCTSFTEQLQSLFARARRVTTVKPTTITTWPTAVPAGLIKLGTKLVAYSSASSTLFSYDLLTQEQSSLTTSLAPNGFAAGTVPKENDYAILINRSGQILKITPTDINPKSADISFPTDSGHKISGAVVYNRRLYSIDAGTNEIFKHDSITSGFGQGKEWLKGVAPFSLRDATDITIDGDIFIAQNNGQIHKFTSGVEQPFQIQGLDPSLVSGGKIWTYNDTTYLYVLDSAGKRLIILNKDGTLERQITASEFQYPSGFVIDETNNSAYIFDNGKLFKINLK